MMNSWFLITAAWAAELQDPPTVRREIARGVWVDWTDLAIEVSARSRGRGTDDTEAVEQVARREVDAAIRQAAERIPLTQEANVGDLESDTKLWEALASRLSRWEVQEGAYSDAGEVTLTAALSLQDLLKPYTLHEAKPAPPPEDEPTWTGLVIDARGLDLEPSWAPSLTDAQGAEVLALRMWEEEAVNTAPLVYVSDPAHPAAARAGLNPLFVRASGADGRAIVIGGEDQRRLTLELLGKRVLGEGHVVIVVDP